MSINLLMIAGVVVVVVIAGVVIIANGQNDSH